MQARGLEMMRKLALIVSFCLGTVAGPAFALGLGEIELQSALNEPLRAEIQLFAVRPGQRDLITARVADTAAFTRAGIERSSILSDIRFAVAPGATADQAVLQLKTLTPVREPFLSMLIEVSWPEGRLIREYTALVDPPGTARAPSSRARPADSGGLTTRPYAPAGEAPTRPSDAGAHEYGPVRADETLWSIAYAQRPSDSITMDQMMLAIYEANPDAFDGSVNRIRAGSMLRIPSAQSIRAIDPNQARREVGQQRRRERARAPAREEVAEAPPAVAPPPAEAEPAPPPKPKGELRLSPPEGAAPTPAAPQGDTLPAPPPLIVEEAPAVAPPAASEAAPPDPAPVRGTTPIEIRDNSAKALELLAQHAREHSAQQAAGDQLAAETAQPSPTPTPEPTQPPVVTPAPAPAPVPTEAAPPVTPSAPVDSPFADQPTEAQPSSPTAPAPPATGQEPAVEPAPPVSPPRPPPPEPVVADEDGVLGALNPLMLGLAAAAALLIGLGAVKLRQRGRRPVTLAPIVLSEVEPGASTFGQTLEAPAPRRAGSTADTLQSTVPAAARTVETTMQSTMPPERTTQQFMAVSTPQPSPTPPPPAPVTAPGGVDPYADALSEVDIHIAYGLYDEAARLLQEPLAKSPERKDLHLKLLEVYFSANLPSEFEAQAKTMRTIVGDDADPDWQKACIMGQQLCPTSSLFAAGSAGTGAAIGATADMDFSSLLGSAPTTPTVPAPTASPPALDFGGLDLGLDKAATVKPPPKPAPPPAAPEAEASSLDFNLDDFKLDVPASVSTPAPAAAAPDDTGLDIDLSDFDVGAPPAAPAAPSAAPAGGDIDMDDLLTADAVEGTAEQADTRLDLARAYMDMGEPAMAQSLLQEVIAQGNPGQKQEAQELLNRLNAG